MAEMSFLKTFHLSIISRRNNLGPLNYVADLPGRRPLRSAGTNRLAMPPVKLTTVANQPGFPGCQPTDVERSARRRGFSRIIIHLPSGT